MTDSKYRIANRCPDGLPKNHGGKEWLKLISSPETPPFLEGLVKHGGKICALAYHGKGKVVAMPLVELPFPSFTCLFSASELKQLDEWSERYAKGEWVELESEKPDFAGMF